MRSILITELLGVFVNKVFHTDTTVTENVLSMSIYDLKICLCVHVFVCLFVCVCVFMHVFICVYVYLFLCLFVCMHVFVCVYLFVINIIFIQ